MSATALASDHSVHFPALSPEISARLMDSLIAAVPQSDGSAGDDPLGHGATIAGEVDALHPRDLEEALLATQLLAAHHGAMACFRAAMQHDPASREASRLRRDAMALQRAAAATVRALHKSQARPVQQDAAGLPPRPTVPTTPPPQPPRPATTRRRKPEDTLAPGCPAGDSEAPSAGGRPQPTDVGLATRPDLSEAEAEAQAPETPPPDVFEHRPELQRLDDRWDSLPQWEDMTLEQRRETFGYVCAPPRPATDPGQETGARPPE